MVLSGSQAAMLGWESVLVLFLQLLSKEGEQVNHGIIFFLSFELFSAPKSLARDYLIQLWVSHDSILVNV